MPTQTPDTSEANDLAAQVMDQVAHRSHAAAESAPTPPGHTRRRVTLAALVVAAPVCAVLLFVNLTGQPLTAYFEPTPAPMVARQRAQAAVELVAADLEDFFEDFAELPDSLAEIGVPVDGEWSYTVIGADRFKVVLKRHGQVVAFESSERPISDPVDPEP